MGEFFFEYGLFTAKTITVLVAILAVLIIIGFIVSARARTREQESIEIEKINDKYDAMQEAFEEDLLSKDEIKAKQKQKAKLEKQKDKEIKKRIKEGIEEPLRPRIFVLRFTGDMSASEVDTLREAITAVLLVAQKTDEVLVTIDSSGGYVHNYGLGASLLQRIRERGIPLTASIDLVAASGGYLMASVANKIIAAPFAVVGSIGVLAQIPNFYRLLKKHDIDIEQHTAGEYKTTLTMFGENTNKDREKFQEELEDTHTLFKQFVKEHRPSLDIQKLATGEHWYGAQAVELRLVDEIMTSDEYLLKHHPNTDLFEVKYVIQETLAEKISNIIHGVSMKLFRKLIRVS